MDTLTRRRMVAIGLSLSGMIALPRTGAAQTNAEPKKTLPVCESKKGSIGDWDWFASSSGGIVSAMNVRVVERGDYIGDPDEFFLFYGSEWVFKVRLGRQPASNSVALIVSGGSAVTGDFARAGFPPPAQGSYSTVTLNVTPFLTGKAGPATAKEITLELRDGKRTMCKFAVGTQGFAEAVAKANAEGQPIKAMYDSGLCEPLNIDDCYLTTLCVEQIGLPDDCFELQALRAYRDGPLKRLPEGDAVIAEYYAEAPHIVAEMKRRGEARHVLGFYLTHILPCVAFAKLGLDRLALWRYRDMTRKLQAAYGRAPLAVEAALSAARSS